MKFAVPLLENILHILTKNQLGGHFESVVNDVRVTSCSNERLSNEKVGVQKNALGTLMVTLALHLSMSIEVDVHFEAELGEGGVK